MPALTSAINVLSVSLLKYVGKEVLATSFSGDPAALELLNTILTDASGKLASPIARALDSLSLNRQVRRRIEAEPTIFDLAGIAWGQALAERSDVDFAPFGIRASTVRTALSPTWFVEVLMGISGPEIGLGWDTGRWSPRDRLEPELLTRIVRQTEEEALEALGFPTSGDELLRSFIRDVIMELPDRIANLFVSLPGVNDIITRISAESARDAAQATYYAVGSTLSVVTQIAERLDGTQAQRDAKAAMAQIAASNLALLERDVFGRESASSDEFGLLPLESTYVEPSIEGKPALEMLQTTLVEQSNGLVLLLAPFGFGKSLTVKMLATRMTEQWVFDPNESRLPVLMHAPDVLTTHARTAENAILLYLEGVLHLDGQVATALLRDARLLLIFDSFDEVLLDQREAQSWIQMLHRIAQDCRHRVMVASREHALETQWLRAKDCTFHIQPFNKSRIDDWLRRTQEIVHDGSLTAEQVMRWLGDDLAGTPILLLMAAWDWNRSEVNRALSKTDLYDRFIGRIARGKWKGVQHTHAVVEEGAHTIDQLRGEGSFQSALARIAWAHFLVENPQMERFRQSTGGLPLSDVETILRREFRSSDDQELPKDALRAIKRSIVLSVFVRRAESDEGLRFAHKSFREFLCAKYLVECLQERECGGYIHPAIAALSQVPLGVEELKFSADLVRGLGELECPRILKFLDEMIVGQKGVLLKSRDVEIVGERVSGNAIVLPMRKSGLLRQSFHNAEALALAIRERSMLLRSWLFSYRYTGGAFPMKGKYRIVSAHAHPFYLGYELRGETDELVALLSKDALAEYGDVDIEQRPPLWKYDDDGNWVVPLPWGCRFLGHIKHFVPRLEDDAPITLDEICDLGRRLAELHSDGYGPCGESLVAWKSSESWVVFPLVKGNSALRHGASLPYIWVNLASTWMSEQHFKSAQVLDGDIFSDIPFLKALLALSPEALKYSLRLNVPFEELIGALMRFAVSLIRDEGPAEKACAEGDDVARDEKVPF